MRHPITSIVVSLAFLAAAGHAHAGVGPFQRSLEPCPAESARVNPWAVNFAAPPAAPAFTSLRVTYADSQAARRVIPVEYSDAYKVRAKIHRIASFATIPLFVANYVVGQDLYNHPGESESKKGLHGGLAATTGILFGVNSVTGVWNLWEGRKDPSHKARRMTHGILMLAADAGFLATGMLAPNSEGPYQDYLDRRSTHRAVALTSMGVATVGYLMMLIWR